jgi:hypothetical protein
MSNLLLVEAISPSRVDAPTIPGDPESLDSGSAWLDRFLRPLASLGADTGTLLILMLAVNAVIHPYLGFDHDTRLYAAQTLERVRPGLLSGDLFLQFGSQDRYSVFSLLMAPLASLVGLAPAFLVAYLLSKALLFWGSVRLLGALVRDRVAVALGALFLAMVPAPFGGNNIFCVNESFLTPRLASCGLTLLALELLLAGRAVWSLVLLGGAFLLHPVMALGGVMVWGLFVASRRLSPVALGGLILIVGVCGAAAVVWVGPIDDVWRAIVLRTCFFIRPALWHSGDWLRIGWGVAVVVAAAVGYARGSARLLWSMLAVAAIGLVGTVVGLASPYLLLLQTCPYRNMWLVEFLAVPLGIAWALDLLRRGTCAASAAGFAVLAAATTDCAHYDPMIAVVSVAAFIFFVILKRGMDRAPKHVDWLPSAACSAFLVGFVVQAVSDLRTLAFLWLSSPDPALGLDIHPLKLLRDQGSQLYKLPVFVVLCLLVRRLGTGAPLRGRFVALGVCVASMSLICWLDSSAWYGQRFTAQERRKELIVEVLRKRDLGRPATVYWHTDLRDLWFGLEVRSYFNTMQMSGCAFNRETAVEGWRRSRLVSCFEIASFRRNPPSDQAWRDALNEFFLATPDEPAPTRESLFQLCADPVLDVVVIAQDYPGLWAATDGTYYVYDAECVRQRAQSEPALHTGE